MARKVFRRGDLPDPWPFTVDEVVLIKNKLSIYVKIEDRIYSINGMAYEHTKIPFPHQAGFQISVNGDGNPPFVDVASYIQAGLNLREEGL